MHMRACIIVCTLPLGRCEKVAHLIGNSTVTTASWICGPHPKSRRLPVVGLVPGGITERTVTRSMVGLLIEADYLGCEVVGDFYCDCNWFFMFEHVLISRIHLHLKTKITLKHNNYY